jgi:DNA-binding response OmpR family regulator
MVKILLVFEDFNELTLTETYLKKVGFDVVGITNEVLVSDQILSFNPDIIVAFGNKSRVSSFSIGQKMKENHRYHGKVVIVVPKDVRPSPDDILRMKMDGILEAPLDPERMVQVLARLAGQSPQAYVDKLNKARFSDDGEIAKRMSSAPAADGGAQVIPLNPRAQEVSFEDPQRMKKYADFTKDVEFDVQQSTHQRKDLKDKQKDLKKGWDFETLEELDQLKRQFAEALFRKK